MAQCYCQLAGTIWEINCSDAAILADFSQRYKNFTVAAQPSQCRLFIKTAPAVEDYAADHGVPRFHKEGARIYACHSGSYDGYYDLQSPEAHFSIADPALSPVRCSSTYLSIGNIIRLMIMIWLPHYRRLLLHSSSVVIEGRGYLFIGQSGYGKSTLAKLFDREALSGDLTLVGPDESGRICIWPTFLDLVDWVERFPVGYPLERIYLLGGHFPYSISEFSGRAAKMKAILENSVGVAWQQAAEMLQLANLLTMACPMQKITYLLTDDGREQLPYLRRIITNGAL